MNDCPNGPQSIVDGKKTKPLCLFPLSIDDQTKSRFERALREHEESYSERCEVQTYQEAQRLLSLVIKNLSALQTGVKTIVPSGPPKVDVHNNFINSMCMDVNKFQSTRVQVRYKVSEYIKLALLGGRTMIFADPLQLKDFEMPILVRFTRETNGFKATFRFVDSAKPYGEVYDVVSTFNTYQGDKPSIENYFEVYDMLRIEMGGPAWNGCHERTMFLVTLNPFYLSKRIQGETSKKE